MISCWDARLFLLLHTLMLIYDLEQPIRGSGYTEQKEQFSPLAIKISMPKFLLFALLSQSVLLRSFTLDCKREHQVLSNY